MFSFLVAAVLQVGPTSYLVDCPNGGRITLRNCRLHQSADADNGTMIAIGEEDAYPETSLVNEGNTFVNDRAAGCVEVRWEKMLRP